MALLAMLLLCIENPKLVTFRLLCKQRCYVRGITKYAKTSFRQNMNEKFIEVERCSLWSSLPPFWTIFTTVETVKTESGIKQMHSLNQSVKTNENQNEDFSPRIELFIFH